MLLGARAGNTTKRLGEKGGEGSRVRGEEKMERGGRKERSEGKQEEAERITTREGVKSTQNHPVYLFP